MISIFNGKKRNARGYKFMHEEDRRSEIRNRLNLVFQEVFDDDDIKIYDEMTADDIEEWDSLMHIALVVAVENDFNMQFNAAEIGELKNIGEMITLIAQRGAD